MLTLLPVTRMHTITIIIIIIIFLICCITCWYNSVQAIEPYVDIKPINNNNGSINWTRSYGCKYMMNSTLEKVLKEYGINSTNTKDWVLYFPCTYNYVDKELEEIVRKNKSNDPEKRIFIVNNCDELSSKSRVWTNLVNKFGIDTAETIMPMTYVLSNKEDRERLKQNYHKDKVYIMKKNIQRQQGLLITKDKNKLLNGSNDNYVIAQEMMPYCYTISKRKINMRFYLLLICQNKDISGYVHKEGFMYYTKVPYINGTTRSDPNITTGYIDRQVYKENPLTLGDFRNYLDSTRSYLPVEQQIAKYNQKISDVVFNRIYQILSHLVDATKDLVCSSRKLEPYITFQLFGVDVGLDEQLDPKIIEVNKGPDLGSKDGRDGAIKKKVVTDLLRVLKVVPDYDNHDFIEIYS